LEFRFFILISFDLAGLTYYFISNWLGPFYFVINKSKRTIMETIRNLSAILTLTLLFVSCSFQETKLKKGHVTSTLIHIDPSETSKDSIPMSLIAERIEYIPLQMTDSAVLSYPYDFKVSNDFIFIRENNCILKFSKEGRFIKRLFIVGSGPGESIANSFAINESDNLVYAYDVHSRKGNIYDFNGKFIQTFDVNLCDPSYWISSIDYFQSNIFVSILLRPGTGYLFSSFDLRNDSVRVLHKNSYIFTAFQEQQTPMIVLGNNAYQVTPSDLFFKERYCDTLFIVDKDFQAEPLYIIDLGNDKMHWEDFRDHGMFNISDGPPNGYWIESFADTHSFLFLMAKSFKAPGLLCIYLKDSDSTVISSNRGYKTQEQLVYMKNDLDYLVPFPPMRKQTGQFLYYEECLYSVIEAKDFTAVYNAASTEKRTSSEYLRKMAPVFSKIDEFSNPVIMKVYLK